MSHYRHLAVASLCLGLVACSTTTPPQQAPVPAPAIRIPLGPEGGFSIRQVLTAKTQASWMLNAVGREPVTHQRQSGLRFIVNYTVLDHSRDSATIAVTVEETQILSDGKFITAPFQQFRPPDRFVFSLDFKAKAADFSPLREAFTDFVNAQKGTFAGMAMSNVFDPLAYSAQLGDLLRLPPLGFSGRRFPHGQPLVEWVRFYLPLLAPSVSFGPFPVMQSTRLMKLSKEKAGPVGTIESQFSSEELGLAPEEIQSRFALLSAVPPLIYESQGNLRGTMTSKVSMTSGWALAASSTFRSLITANFEGGELTEEILGEKTVTTIDDAKP